MIIRLYNHKTMKEICAVKEETVKKALEKAIEEGIDLSFVNLSGHDLSEFNFGAGVFYKAHFSNCNLTGSDFGSGKFSQATFSNCKMGECILGRGDFSNSRFSEVTLAFSQVNLSNFTGAKFTSTKFNFASLSYTVAKTIRFYDCDFRYCYANDMRFRNCSLKEVNFRGCILTEAEFEDCGYRNIQGNGEEVISATLGSWEVVIVSNTMSIGCRQATLEEWNNFTDEELESIHPGALPWWKKWGDVISQICYRR